MSFFAELKRRNVFRVAAAYAVVAWLLIEISDTVFPRLGLPEWTVTLVIALLLLGFPVALFFAWAYELTPEGLKREQDVDRSESITPHTGKKLDRAIMVVLALGLAFFAFDKFVLAPQRDETLKAAKVAAVEEARQAGRSEAVTTTEDNRSIAVLAFDDMSPEGDQEYLSDGIAEELLNLLARVPELRVISRSSAFSFKGQNLEIPQIAERLNVAHVLEGSVRKSGDRVRITVQLIDARADTNIWSETYDRTLDDIFAIQDEIARTVVNELRVTLLGEMPKAEETTSEAYALFLEARQARLLFTAEGLARSIELNQRALAADPGYAAARLALGVSYINQASAGLRPFDDGYTRARQLVEEVIAVEPDNAQAHALLAWIARIYDGDLPTAARHTQQAVASSSGDLAIISNTSQLLWQLGRRDEAIAFLEHAVVLDPLSPLTKTNLAMVYLAAGRMDEAIELVLETLERSPGVLMARFVFGLALLEQGDTKAALEEFEREPNAEYRAIGCFAACPALGLEGNAGEALSQLIAVRPQYEALYRASYLAWSGQPDEAFEWLDKFAASGVAISNVQREFALRKLHSDPHWELFLESIDQSPEQLAAINLVVELPR